METTALLTQLNKKGYRLSVKEKDGLAINAPKSVWNRDDLETIKSHKQALLNLMQSLNKDGLYARADTEEALKQIRRFRGIQAANYSFIQDQFGMCRLVCTYKATFIDNSQFIAFLKSKMPAHLVPDHLVNEQNESGVSLNQVLNSTQVIKPFKEASDMVENIMTEIWKDILGHENISVLDNFFLLGGDYDKAFQITEYFYKKCGMLIPVLWVTDAINIERLAARISERFTWKSSLNKEYREEENPNEVILAQLTQQPDLPQLFFVPPLGGILPSTSMVGIISMIPHMRDHVSLYSLQSPAMDSKIEFLIQNSKEVKPEEWTFDPARIREIATEAADKMQEVQPEGPYQLGGFCTGCFLTFEIARVLEERGASIESLVLIDPTLEYPPLDQIKLHYTLDELAWFIAKDLAESTIDYDELRETLASTAPEDIWETGAKLLHSAPVRIGEFNAEELRLAAEVKFYNSIVLDLYFSSIGYKYPKINARKALLIGVQGFKEYVNQPVWMDYIRANVLTGEIQIEDADGDHGTIFLEPAMRKWVEYMKDLYAVSV